MKKTLLLPLFFFCVDGFCQSSEPLVKLVNPKSLHTPKGYSHMAVVNLGTCRMIILSGQVPLDAQGNLVGKGDVAKQTEQVFQNIKSAITDAGGNMEHLVKLGYFLMDESDIQSVRDVRDKFINTKNPPASTLVKVSHLYRDDVLLEVEATFIIPNK